MCVPFNVLECCSMDLLRHCHRYPLSRHSRIRRPWMLSPPFPCRQRRHEGHPFGSYHQLHESQHHRCEMRLHTCGLWHRRLREGPRVLFLSLPEDLAEVVSSSTTVPEITDDTSLCRILLPFSARNRLR